MFASIDGEGRVDEQKIKEILNELKNQPRTKTLPVLKNLLSLVRQKINSYEGQLEIASSNIENISDTLSINLSDTFNRKIDLLASTNNSLLSGFRLRIGDNVYEDSLRQRINSLQKALT